MKKKHKATNFIEKAIGLPADMISGCSHFEINGNKEAVIEGCRSILQYDENVVRINMGKMITSFEGRDLQIKCLKPDSLVIEGFITEIRFDN